MKFYLAGPMTGLPHFNFPAFTAAASDLRAHGYDIVSPAEMDSPAVKAAAHDSVDGALTDGKVAGETWGDMLARDVKVIADTCDGVIMLPDWQKSRGARLELFVALLSNKTYFGYYVAGTGGNPVRWVAASVVRQIIRENMP